MKQKLNNCNLISDDLTDIVAAEAENAVHNANRSGMKEQLNLLYSLGLSDEDIFKAVVREQLEEGYTVDVSEPKHPDSPHSVSFTGTVERIKRTVVTVRDMEDNHFDVEFDEIISFKAD